MPKAKPFSDSDEEEKTTNDSQWEDEASTTVEQGDVADKVRALVDNARVTITNETESGGLEDSTVDEQRADLGIGITPPPRDELARLVITQGNDLGQEIAIQPGKSYSIGRAIDNDFVLTDIAVSRKHFDLRNDDGAWVIVDRGSGNGTVVNGNIEDNPFMLANGDLIEIGNTVFRFEHPNGVARRAVEHEVDLDEEELSTVAGKPLRGEPAEAATPVEAPLRLEPPRQRPKTLPPPTPLRPQAAPPFVMPAQPQPAAMPMSINRPANAPTMLGDSRGMPLPGVMPTTIPGQGPMTPQRPIQYPMATEIPPHSVHAQMMKIAANAGRTDPSTSIVPPTPYNAMLMPAPAHPAPPQQLSKRTKYLIGAGGLGLLAAILTIAVVKSGGSKSATASTTTAASQGSGTRTKMEEIKPAEASPPAPAPQKVATADPPKVAPPPPPPPTPPPPAPAKVETPKPVEQPKVETPKPVEQPKVETPKQTDTVKQDKRPARQDKVQAKRQTVAVAPPPPPPPRNDPPPPPPKNDSPPPTPKKDPEAAIRASDQAYGQRHFSEASNLLIAASKGASDSDGQKLRHRAETIDRFSKQFSAGTAPPAPPAEVYERMRAAQPFDQALGGQFKSEIDDKLKQTSSKAALSYMAQKLYEKAATAVQTSESLGISNNNTKLVRQSLDNAARDLYNDANKEVDSNPSDAREKLRKLLQFTDTKSPVSDKARKLLKQLDK